MNISAIRQRLSPSVSLSDSRRSRHSPPEPRKQGGALARDGPLATAVREPDLHCAPPPTLAGKFRERKAIGGEKLRIYDNVRDAKVAAFSLYGGGTETAQVVALCRLPITRGRSGRHAAAGVD